MAVIQHLETAILLDRLSHCFESFEGMSAEDSLTHLTSCCGATEKPRPKLSFGFLCPAELQIYSYRATDVDHGYEFSKTKTSQLELSRLFGRAHIHPKRLYERPLSLPRPKSDEVILSSSLYYRPQTVFSLLRFVES